ncbi:RNI-like protein [Lentinula edodes]|uniref:RNI-like protein n=1 Tax=Lentinula edodes TaxID=5353 RepID=A0A1Q3DXW5_LENED|nr:RNI-like protein [Lentinula edodes]
MDSGLRSVAGAKHIIELILSRRMVTKLILGNNTLSDDGCILLFTFLSSPLGRRYPISEISLNANRIGDRGLAAIAAYLVENTTLTELFLQDVSFDLFSSGAIADHPTELIHFRLQYCDPVYACH